MVDRRKTLHRDLVARLPTERSDLATAAIPAQSAIEQIAVRRAPLPYYAPRSVAARCYQDLLVEALGGHPPLAVGA